MRNATRTFTAAGCWLVIACGTPPVERAATENAAPPAAAEDAPAPEQDDRVLVVFFGDSLTAG